MTILTLTSLHIAYLSDLSDVLTLRAHTFDASTDDPAGVRRRSGGRDVIVRTPGRTRSFQVTAVQVSRDDFLDLEDRVGVGVFMRDTRGRRFAGLISGVQASEFRPVNLLGSVSFTFTTITFSEVVI